MACKKNCPGCPHPGTLIGRAVAGTMAEALKPKPEVTGEKLIEEFDSGFQEVSDACMELIEVVMPHHPASVLKFLGQLAAKAARLTDDPVFFVHQTADEIMHVMNNGWEENEKDEI